MRHTEFILEKQQKDDLMHLAQLKALAGTIDIDDFDRRRILDRLNTTEKLVKTRQMKSRKIGETTASSVASVSGNVGASMQRRNPDGTAVNALDSDTPLMGKKTNKKKARKTA